MIFKQATKCLPGGGLSSTRTCKPRPHCVINYTGQPPNNRNTLVEVLRIGYLTSCKDKLVNNWFIWILSIVRWRRRESRSGRNGLLKNAIHVYDNRIGISDIWTAVLTVYACESRKLLKYRVQMQWLTRPPFASRANETLNCGHCCCTTKQPKYIHNIYNAVKSNVNSTFHCKLHMSNVKL